MSDDSDFSRSVQVLIVDDDEDIRQFVKIALGLGGFDVIEGVDGIDGIAKAIESRPDVIVMDVMMPRLDGVGAVKELRADGRVSHIPIIMLTAKTQVSDKIEGLEAGADDYLTKPFDPQELVARLNSTIRRAQEMRTIQPLTGLPGNVTIDKELSRRVIADGPFALLYLDLNNFKAYNDHYGFQRGDEVLARFGQVAVDVANRLGGKETFVGHVGGDDFVVITSPELAEDMAQSVCTEFDRVAPEHYDAGDRDRGHLEVADRQGQVRRYPLVGVSIGIASTAVRRFDHPSEAVTVSTEMKSFAKGKAEAGGSNYAFDRRTVE